MNLLQTKHEELYINIEKGFIIRSVLFIETEAKRYQYYEGAEKDAIIKMIANEREIIKNSQSRLKDLNQILIELNSPKLI